MHQEHECPERFSLNSAKRKFADWFGQPPSDLDRQLLNAMGYTKHESGYWKMSEAFYEAALECSFFTGARALVEGSLRKHSQGLGSSLGLRYVNGTID